MKTKKIATVTFYSHTQETFADVNDKVLWEKFNNDPWFNLACCRREVDNYGVTRIFDVLSPAN